MSGESRWDIGECGLSRPLERRFAAAGCLTAGVDGSIIPHLFVFGGISFEGGWNDAALVALPM